MGEEVMNDKWEYLGPIFGIVGYFAALIIILVGIMRLNNVGL